jgi:predicted nucleic acid-binding protein
MSKLYIDTNLFINVINDEVSKHSNRNMAEPASRLFFDAITCKHTLLISTWTLKELSGRIPAEMGIISLELLKNKTIICRYSSEEELQAKTQHPEHFHDALHIIIAEREKADFIVTRNLDDFIKIGTKIPVKKPELL